LIEAGDKISVEIYANLVSEDYVWRWNTFVLSQGQKEHVKADLKQSTFYGIPLSQGTLQKIANNHVPMLEDEGLIDQFILSQMNGNTSLGEIAERLLDSFPDHFPKWYDALTRVGQLSKKYSR